MSKNWLLITAVGLTLVMSGWAHAQQGPVATACSTDISKFCADKKHGQGKFAPS